MSQVNKEIWGNVHPYVGKLSRQLHQVCVITARIQRIGKDFFHRCVCPNQGIRVPQSLVQGPFLVSGPMVFLGWEVPLSQGLSFVSGPRSFPWGTQSQVGDTPNPRWG